MRAQMSSSMISRVRQVITEVTRALSTPEANSAATWGRWSRSDSAMRSCPHAFPWEIVIAAATSAAVASKRSHAQFFLTSSSSGSRAGIRRVSSSPMAAVRNAAAVFSARTASAMVATNPASSSDSNTCSIMPTGSDTPLAAT
jgi:hypothetical protein